MSRRAKSLCSMPSRQSAGIRAPSSTRILFCSGGQLLHRLDHLLQVQPFPGAGASRRGSGRPVGVVAAVQGQHEEDRLLALRRLLRSSIRASHCSGWSRVVGSLDQLERGGIEEVHGLGVFETASIPLSPFQPSTLWGPSGSWRSRRRPGPRPPAWAAGRGRSARPAGPGRRRIPARTAAILKSREPGFRVRPTGRSLRLLHSYAESSARRARLRLVSRRALLVVNAHSPWMRIPSLLDARRIGPDRCMILPLRPGIEAKIARPAIIITTSPAKPKQARRLVRPATTGMKKHRDSGRPALVFTDHVSVQSVRDAQLRSREALLVAGGEDGFEIRTGTAPRSGTRAGPSGRCRSPR